METMQYLFKPLRGKQRSLVDAAQRLHEFEFEHVKHEREIKLHISAPAARNSERGPVVFCCA